MCASSSRESRQKKGQLTRTVSLATNLDHTPSSSKNAMDWKRRSFSSHRSDFSSWLDWWSLLTLPLLVDGDLFVFDHWPVTAVRNKKKQEMPSGRRSTSPFFFSFLWSSSLFAAAAALIHGKNNEELTTALPVWGLLLRDTMNGKKNKKKGQENNINKNEAHHHSVVIHYLRTIAWHLSNRKLLVSKTPTTNQAFWRHWCAVLCVRVFELTVTMSMTNSRTGLDILVQNRFRIRDKVKTGAIICPA